MWVEGFRQDFFFFPFFPSGVPLPLGASAHSQSPPRIHVIEHYLIVIVPWSTEHEIVQSYVRSEEPATRPNVSLTTSADGVNPIQAGRTLSIHFFQVGGTAVM